MAASHITLHTSLAARLRRLVTNMPYLFNAILSIMFSWRTLLFLLAITNLKSIPFSWHYRLFSGMARFGRTPKQNRQRLQKAADDLPPANTFTSTNPKPVHPIFRPRSMLSRAPLAECDYNLHKSNSTYFSDLDLSRGYLVSSLFDPALRQNTLVPHGIRKGLCYPILGSVHTSFLREIKPYEKYDVRSRVLGWDRKWIVIGSWFVRKATKQELAKDKAVPGGKNMLKGPIGAEEVVFACVLNKYIIKAGRFTVPPELALAASGWFPVRPEATATVRAMNSNKAERAAGNPAAMDSPLGAGTGTGTGTPDLGPEKVVVDAANAVQNVAIEAGRRLSMSADKGKVLLNMEKGDLTSTTDDDFPGWSWEEIEEERQRGLKIAEQWLDMDVVLRKAYENEMERKIWDL